MTPGEGGNKSAFLRFAVVGTVGFAVNEIALFGAVHFLKTGPYVGGILAFFVAVTAAWLGNRTFTFQGKSHTRKRDFAAEWAKYVAANGLGITVNYAVFAGLVRFGPPPVNSPYLALAAGTIAGLVFNFTMSKRFVFRS